MLNDFARKFAALALTLVASTTLVLSAVGPATSHDGNGAVASAARFMA